CRAPFVAPPTPTFQSTLKDDGLSHQEIRFRKTQYIDIDITHRMEYYSAIKNEILPFAAALMNLENIILGEGSQILYG
ncbi:hypothetical protein, partial [Streptococcus pneumoniae]|uniref:hypothetical protein n=1 Tax=Streptococcus pneumoniae TaxID=1313 RepID=UPI00307FAD02